MNYLQINQPAGIGDICFLQKMASVLYQEHGYKIIWPIADNLFLCISQIINDAVIFVKQSEITEFCQDKNILQTLNIVNADQYIPNSTILESKYRYVRMTSDNWQNYFLFKRNIKRENELFYDKLGLTIQEEFFVVNKNYGTPPNSLVCKHMNIDWSKKYPIKLIEMDMSMTDNVFDWCLVLEKMKYFHTVDTCFQYFLENINTEANLNVYSRYNPPDFRHIKHLFRKSWNYLQTAII